MAQFAKQTRLYAQALSNPYKAIKTLPGIPTLLSLPSHKWKARVRTTMVVGDTGVGFAQFNPALAAPNALTQVTWPAPWLDTDLFPVITTTSNFTTTGKGDNIYQLWDATTGNYHNGLVGGVSDSPYTEGWFRDANDMSRRTYRVVAAGIKIRYRGTELNRGGTISLWRNPVANPDNPSTETYLLASHHSVRAPVDRKWHSVTYRPAISAQFDYRNLYDHTFMGGPVKELGDAKVGSGLEISGPVCGGLISVTGGTQGDSYDVEADFYYEALGPNLTKTFTPPDPVGMSAVVAANRTVANAKQPAHEEHNTAVGMLQHLKNGVTTAGQIASAAQGVYKAAESSGLLGFLEDVGGGLLEVAEDVGPALLTML